MHPALTNTEVGEIRVWELVGNFLWFSRGYQMAPRSLLAGDPNA